MRGLLVVMILLLAGCASDAPETAEPVAEAPPAEPDPATIPSEAVAILPEVYEETLELSCHGYLGGIYVYVCPTGTGAPSASPRSMPIHVADVAAMVVEYQQTKGDGGQILARGDTQGTWFYREDMVADGRFVLEADDWGGMAQVDIELGAPAWGEAAGLEVWAGYDIWADVTVTTYAIRPADLDSLCTVC